MKQIIKNKQTGSRLTASFLGQIDDWEKMAIEREGKRPLTSERREEITDGIRQLEVSAGLQTTSGILLDLDLIQERAREATQAIADQK